MFLQKLNLLGAEQNEEHWKMQLADPQHAPGHVTIFNYIISNDHEQRENRSKFRDPKPRSHSLKNMFLQKLSPLGAKKVERAEKCKYRTHRMLLGV